VLTKSDLGVATVATTKGASRAKTQGTSQVSIKDKNGTSAAKQVGGNQITLKPETKASLVERKRRYSCIALTGLIKVLIGEDRPCVTLSAQARLHIKLSAWTQVTEATIMVQPAIIQQPNNFPEVLLTPDTKSGNLMTMCLSHPCQEAI
jgi:hypothetical protein